MVTHPPTQRWIKKTERGDGKKRRKKRRSSTSRIVDITETRNEPRTNTTSEQGGNDRK